MSLSTSTSVHGVNTVSIKEKTFDRFTCFEIHVSGLGTGHTHFTLFVEKEDIENVRAGLSTIIQDGEVSA